MFRVHVNDGSTPLPSDDICYIVAKEGVFLKKKMGIMESIAPVSNISILKSVETAAKMHIKKIPGGQFARVIAFFKEVYAKFRGEAIVLLFYDEDKKTYKIIPPHQKVSGAACDYNKAITIDGMKMIGTIHSHANMSAFHSGTDDKDEEHFDGLHITVGNVSSDDVSITASIVANGHRFVVQPEEYVERLELTVDIDQVEQRPTRKVYRWINGKLTEVTEETGQYTYSYRKYDKRYKVNVSDRYHRVIPEWMDMVEQGSVAYTYVSRGVQTANQPWNKWRQRQWKWDKDKGWGGNFDSSLWNDRLETKPKNSIYNTGVKVKPIEFPPHDIEDSDIPCNTCKFRDHKLLMEQEEDSVPNVFKCEQCGHIVFDDLNSPIMPICKLCGTDEFLEEIDDDPDYFTEENISVIQKDDGVKEVSDYIKCETCGTSFHLFSREDICPFCYSELEVYSSEDSLVRQSLIDSGEYASSETEEINRAAIEEAEKFDMIPSTPIPDPNEGNSPIPEQIENKSQESIFQMFKNVFRKENK